MAAKFRFTVLWTFVVLLQISLSSEKITSVERHLVAVRGSNVTLRCVNSLTKNTVFWIYKRPEELSVAIVSRGMAEAEAVQHVIEGVDFSHSGSYKCQDESGTDNTELIVVGDNSSCRLGVASREVVEQEVVTFTCRLSYSGNSVPYLRWTDSDNNSKEGVAVERPKGVNAFPEIESRINVTIDRYGARPYRVSLCLSETGTKCLPFWQSPSLRVFVSVVNITIAQVALTAGGGTMALNCSAVGYPTPSYLWLDSDGRQTLGSIVLLSDSPSGLCTYKCIAWNTFRSRNYTVESRIEINLPERSSSGTAVFDESTTAITVTSLASQVFVIDGYLVRVFGTGLLILVAIVAFSCVTLAAIFVSRRRRHQMEPGRRSDFDLNDESSRQIVDEVSQNDTALHTSSLVAQIGTGLDNLTADIYEEINDGDYEKYSKFLGTTSATKEGNQYLTLNCEDECEIQMPSEYMTTLFAAEELKAVRQTLSSEPIVEDHHYLKVLP